MKPEDEKHEESKHVALRQTCVQRSDVRGYRRDKNRHNLSINVRAVCGKRVKVSVCFCARTTWTSLVSRANMRVRALKNLFYSRVIETVLCQRARVILLKLFEKLAGKLRATRARLC